MIFPIFSITRLTNKIEKILSDKFFKCIPLKFKGPSRDAIRGEGRGVVAPTLKKYKKGEIAIHFNIFFISTWVGGQKRHIFNTLPIHNINILNTF